MKQITMDYDTYKIELRERFSAGYKNCLDGLLTDLLIFISHPEIHDGYTIWNSEITENLKLSFVIKEINQLKHKAGYKVREVEE